MTRKSETTVTKCPRCGAVTPGLPERCPTCAHQFADFQKTLPAMREDTIELQTPAGGSPLATVTIPRHVVVPLLAGLLVAVLVAVFVRIGASDHRNSMRVARPDWTARRAAGAAGGVLGDEDTVEQARSARGSPDTREQSGPAGSVPRLGPGTRKLIPVEVRMAPVRPAGQDARSSKGVTDTLFDLDASGCFFPGAPGQPEVVDFDFGYRKRLSHMVVHVDCLEKEDPDLRAFGTIVVDDSSRRLAGFQAVSGRTTVDLGGTLTSHLSLELTDRQFLHFGIRSIEFFAFEN